MRTIIAAIIALATLAGNPARADVGVTLVVKGYSALFKTCEIALGFDTFGTDYARVILGYEIHVDGRRVSACDASWSAEDEMIDTSCRGEHGLAYTCEALTKIRPVNIACRDESGGRMDCGTVKIRGPEIFTFD